MRTLITLAEHIREEQEKLSPDMFNRCTSAHKPFLNHGFKPIQGSYTGPISDLYAQRTKQRPPIPHDFVYHPEHKLYLDITADQFHHSQPRILVMKQNDTRIRTTHQLQR